jgi:2-phospho-L-lactate guanylyltransferase
MFARRLRSCAGRADGQPWRGWRSTSGGNWPADSMRTWAIVPVKPLSLAKSRLAQVLCDTARESLVRRMLEHTLQVLRECQPPLDGTLVVSSDSRVLTLAQEYAAIPLAETGGDGLNAALVQAIGEAKRRRARGVLILPADLPMLSVDALRDVLERMPPAPGVVVVPDRRESGTNALAMQPCDLLAPAYGPGSFRRHCAEGRRRNAHVVVVRSAALALDVDRPEDLEQAGDILS